MRRGGGAAGGAAGAAGPRGARGGGGGGARQRPESGDGGAKAKRRREARPDNDAAAAAPVDSAAELAEVWRQLGEDLGLPAAASEAQRQVALLRYVGCEWAPGGALTARPRGLRPSPLCLDALPASCASAVLALLTPNERYACGAVSRGWRAVVRAPAAWPVLFPDESASDGYLDALGEAAMRLAFFLYRDESAQLPGVRVIDGLDRLSDIPCAWSAVVARCPNLEELRCGLPPTLPLHPRNAERPQEDELLGCERGPSAGELLQMATERPGLRVPGAHVVLRPRQREVEEGEDPIADLAALLALHPRVEVRTLTLSLDLHGLELPDFHEPAQAEPVQAQALAAALAQPGGAALQAVDLGSCVTGDAEAAVLAAALEASCPALRFLRLAGWQWPDEADGDEGDLDALREVAPGFASLLALHSLPATALRPHGVALALEEEDDELQQAEDECFDEDDDYDDAGVFFGHDDHTPETSDDDLPEEGDGDAFGDEADEPDAWG